MSAYDSAAYGIPLEPPLLQESHTFGRNIGSAAYVRREQTVQQREVGGSSDRDRRSKRRRKRRTAKGGETGACGTPQNDRTVDNTIVDPVFWATVFTTLRQNVDVADEIRRDLERQEARCVRDREARAGDVRHRRSDRTDVGAEATPPRTTATTDVPMEEGETYDDDGDTSSDAADLLHGGSPHRESLPDMYDFMANGVGGSSRPTGGVQRLDRLMDELDVGALWSASDVMISFGPLVRVLLRLFVGPYATDEENLIVRMLNLGVERASRRYGFRDDPDIGGSATEPFYMTYRRRGRVLRDFAAFRYMLETAESMGRIGRKHKHELVLLYMTLTTPEVRLHRRWDANDRQHVIAFRDRVTGFAMTTPPVIARPMSIEMHLDSVFGNVSTNTRLLERSLAAALNNRNRRYATGASGVTREVESLLGNARRLDSVPDAVAPFVVGPYTIKRENAALRHMLESCVIVSMMAEEYRVFVAGAPASRCGGGGKSGGSRANRHQTTTTHRVEFNTSGSRPAGSSARCTTVRRPIFFTFKPISQAVTTTK